MNKLNSKRKKKFTNSISNFKFERRISFELSHKLNMKEYSDKVDYYKLTIQILKET